MAIKKPIVLNLTNGQLEQLQGTDSIDLGNTVTKNNPALVTLPFGTPVHFSGGDAIPSQANAQGTIRVAGFVAEDITTVTSGPILIDGKLTAALASDWDSIVTEAGGIVEGTNYFLDEANAGQITAIPPTTGFVVRLGHALSTTEFEIEVQQPIKL